LSQKKVTENAVDALISLPIALRNNTEQKSFVMVRIPAQQPKMTSRIKCFVWNWLRKYAKVHEGNDVDSTPPASTIYSWK
jgi:hypothetical protein